MLGQTITFLETNRHHTGVYTCTAENSEGSPAKGQINLEVTCKSNISYHSRYLPGNLKRFFSPMTDEPEVEIEQSLVSMGEGYNTELTCTVHGEPKPTVFWFKNGQKLDPSATEHQQHHRYSQTSVGSRHVLSIDNVQIHDFANYTCQGENRFGRDEKTIEMTGTISKPVSTFFIHSLRRPHES